jgi:tellurite resistance protein
MAIGARKAKKKSAIGKAREQAVQNALDGICEAAFLAAQADGEVSDEEVEMLANVVHTMLDGQADLDQILSRLEACEEAFENEGFEARMNQIAAKLPSDDARQAALIVAAGVILGDGEYDADSEGAFYEDLAELIGVPEDVATEIWNDVAANFE